MSYGLQISNNLENIHWVGFRMSTLLLWNGKTSFFRTSKLCANKSCFGQFFYFSRKLVEPFQRNELLPISRSTMKYIVLLVPEQWHKVTFFMLPKCLMCMQQYQQLDGSKSCTNYPAQSRHGLSLAHNLYA